MTMDDTPRQRDDNDDSADPYLEWVFSGAHDIEYWVVRDGRLVPAENGDLERIAERERERASVPRLRQWEREKGAGRSSGVFARFVTWCAGLRRHPARPHFARAQASERIETSTTASDSAPRRQSNVVPR